MLLLKRHRIATGKTIAEVARQLNVAESTVCRWESGAASPHPGTLKKLARMLGMSPFKLSLIIEPDEETAVVTAR